MKRALRWAALCGLALVLFAGQALALGLGRIEVKSRAGQPLLAEIQVISSDPAELDELRARLASPETFRRIGLDAPDAVVAGLEFTVALDVRGNPVIRVTTREPVTQPSLTFLVEVDWGQGRLVREYSALVDAPQTVASGAQPVIEAPTAAPSNAIVRGPEPAAGTAADEPPAAAGEDAPSEAVAEAAPEPPPAPAPPPVAPPPAPAPAPPAPAPALADEYGPVQAGETLGTIAQRLVGDGVSREQAIVALFRANPQAFIGNNLNLVRQGAVLRIPDRGEIAGLDLAESRALMREQNAAWRDMTRPAPQPDAALAGDASSAESGAQGEGGRQAAANAPRTADARLEIVPPSASGGQQAGIRSGIQAGGEGEMLRQELQQELQQSQETLAARDAEVAELKARVADLERLQAQQAELISLKDSEMAAAQERLANTAETATAATPAPEQAGGGMPWAWIGLGLLLVAVVAWLLMRRAPRPTPRPRFDSATLAAAAPGPASPKDRPAPAADPDTPAAPAWHAGPPPGAPAAASAASPATRGAEPAPDEAPEGPVEDAAVIASLNPAPGGVERIELARAYIDLGDVDTARDLLREVAETGDPAAREEAARLLEGIA
ncbi:FimV/HubP family polar landmark protein [Luteimonas arsenica]|uniref:FimV/HubP family polar landmark protein n=1 Tax=Luteimonas arsenica TaxID=1586242 RepID=UPI001FB7E137|nr:FimV/HubP family polar landmark protein [Luteimonas arsenica]